MDEWTLLPDGWCVREAPWRDTAASRTSTRPTASDHNKEVVDVSSTRRTAYREWMRVQQAHDEANLAFAAAIGRQATAEALALAGKVARLQEEERAARAAVQVEGRPPLSWMRDAMTTWPTTLA
jgi:hypothetical protein